MKVRDYILTGTLLLLIGLTLGTFFSLYYFNDTYVPLAEVGYTDVKKSEDPFFTDESLEGIGGAFLFKKVAETVTPTVVYIETIIPLEEGEQSVWDAFSSARRARTVGSGVLISENGYILTNNHVVEDAVRNGLKVVLSDKREFSAALVGQDPTTDLAVIKINGEDLPALTVGNSDRVQVGEWVVAIGNPFRLRSTVTAGIVSALGRDVAIIDDRMSIESFIQTDAAINKGNSGGALVNTSGQLIGENTAIASQSGTYQGYGFAVPSNLAIKVATDLIEYGEVKRALLGVSIQSVDYTRARQLDLPFIKGVEIIGLNELGSASEYGVELNDIVLAIDGIEVNESNELQEKVAIKRPGDFIALTIYRGGEQIVKNVRLKEMAPQQIAELQIPEQQIEVDELPGGYESEGDDFFKFDIGFKVKSQPKSGADNEFELVVDEVDKYSEAWNRGLKEGQQILAIGNTSVEDIDTLRDLMRQELKLNKEVTIKIRTKDDVIGFVQLKQ